MHAPIPSPSQSKSEWRQWAFSARRSLDFLSLSQQLHRDLAPLVAESRHVLLYAATEFELEVLTLASPAQHFYLPRCAPRRRLAIHAYPCPLVVSRFGIAEPEAAQPEVEPDVLDLVLVPALVLDQRGFRLGYGGGYYDRFLPRLRPECRRVGIAPFLVDALPTDPWDVPVERLETLLGRKSTGLSRISSHEPAP